VTLKKRQPPIPWEPADKARALVLLRENQGALRATARQWNAQPGARRLTEATLRLWVNDPAQQPVALVIDARRERVDVLKGILRRLEQGFESALEERPGIVSELARKRTKDLATSIGILIDKVRLLEGESTENIAVTPWGELLTQIRDGRAKGGLEVIDGGKDKKVAKG
jgi:hypothetical protein